MTGFTSAAALLGLVVLVAGAVYGAGWLLRVGRSPLQAAPFTGGLPSAEHAVSRYHVRWYAIAMLFLAFDMEMAFMYPWAVVYQEVGLEALVDMGIFLLILFLGLLYGWSQGAFRRQ